MKVKETVMVLLMEVNMMDIEDVKEILYVAAIIARNLESTSTRRTTVVKKHLLNPPKHNLNNMYLEHH